MENQPVKLDVPSERSGPPPPKRRVAPRVLYPFDDLKTNNSYRFPRSEHTVRQRLQAYVKTPEGQGKKFLVRPIGPNTCRVWRVK